jgi:thiosulfate/3-mercaptopyruvate sulfurtransferase
MKKLLATAAAALLLTGASLAEAASPLVDVDWVKANLENEDVVILDVRGGLAGLSKKDYLEGHIPGAIWTNYLKDGWRMKDGKGTIAQLPSVPQLESLISNLGIGNHHHVVIVPQGKKALDVGTATRIYWTFKVLGHEEVSILNGGMTAYTAAKVEGTNTPLNPLETGEVTLEPELFEAELQQHMLIGKEQVIEASATGRLIVDNRPSNQYLGINKHGKALRHGTIPGARNLPENWLTDNGGGTFRSKKEIEQLYQLANVPLAGDQITICNTGHWASLGWFVSHEILGNDKTRLYDGSMVEWAADQSLPVHSRVQRN